MNWNDLFISDEMFHLMYEISNGFNDDINRNHRVREAGESFAKFIDEGSTRLIEENLDIVKSLI
ncbi:hypothetical protein [Faecalibacterium sp. An77]|uniref:hypothetical protein n=1 Tax=Faecalibacterium sp. An77 TaxID=1965655 RepID=UPI0011849652|nr:hypothetical protein [Faecalibacterium sp. An77]